MKHIATKSSKIKIPIFGQNFVPQNHFSAQKTRHSKNLIFRIVRTEFLSRVNQK